MPIRIGTVAQLWRYPVKSMGGERLDSATLTWRGIPGDRGWALYDETRRGITGAKRLPLLRACRARYAREPLAGEASPPAEITLPDGASVRSDSGDAPRRLSDLLGRPVTLHPLGPAGTDTAASHHRGGVGGSRPRPHGPDAGRAGAGHERVPAGAAAPAAAGELLRCASDPPPHPHHPDNARPPRAGVRLGRAPFPTQPAGRGGGERRLSRARMDPPEVRIGAAVIEVVTGCPRCVVVTQSVDEVPQDHRIMRTLVRETSHIAGIYAGVVEEGDVRVGDTLDLLDS